MTPTEPSSGKAATAETLRGLQKKLAGLKMEAKLYGSPFPDSKRQVAEDAYASYEALTALLQQHAALLADYEAVTAENRRLSALNERMRDFVLVAFHKAGCMANIGNGSFDAAGNFSHTTGDCTCGLDALRATLKGERG